MGIRLFSFSVLIGNKFTCETIRKEKKYVRGLGYEYPDGINNIRIVIFFIFLFSYFIKYNNIHHDLTPCCVYIMPVFLYTTFMYKLF